MLCFLPFRYEHMDELNLLKLGHFAFKKKVKAGLRPRAAAPWGTDLGYPDFFKELIAAAWDETPEQRPIFAQIVARFAADGAGCVDPSPGLARRAVGTLPGMTVSS